MRRRHPAASFSLIALLASPLTAYAFMPLADVVAEHRACIAGLGIALPGVWILASGPKPGAIVLAELYVLLRNPRVVDRPLSAADAARICRSFRANPAWGIIDCPRGLMDCIWALCAESNATGPCLAAWRRQANGQWSGYRRSVVL